MDTSEKHFFMNLHIVISVCVCILLYVYVYSGHIPMSYQSLLSNGLQNVLAVSAKSSFNPSSIWIHYSQKIYPILHHEFVTAAHFMSHYWLSKKQFHAEKASIIGTYFVFYLGIILKKTNNLKHFNLKPNHPDNYILPALN